MNQFKEWLLNQGKTENTIKSYLKVVTYFEKWYLSFNSNLNYKDIKPVDLREWKQYLIKEVKKKNGEPLSIKTINNYIESLKTFFKYLEDTKQIKANPSIKLKPQAIKTEYTPRWLEGHEKRKILRLIDDPGLESKNSWRYSRNKLIIYLMLYGGLRISEVLNLTTYDIKDGYIKIREGKGQAARDVPMNKSLSNALSDWLIQRNLKVTNSDFLILSQRNSKMTPTPIYKLFNRLSSEASIKDLTPHTLRHTFANDLIQNGTPIPYVAALLGHNDLDTTRLYTSPKKKNLKDAVDLLSDE